MAATIFCMVLPFSAFGKTQFDVTRVGNDILKGDVIYYPYNTFGAYAYVPLHYGVSEFNSNTVGHAYLDMLRGTDYVGVGGRALRAANRYSGYNGLISNADTLVKTSAQDSESTGNTWVKAPLNIGADYNVNFRYAGLVINGFDIGTSTAKAIIGTNPGFTSDWVSGSASDGNPFTAEVWNNKKQSFETTTVYGSSGGTIYPLEMIYSNGIGQLPANKLWNKDFYHNNGNIGSNQATRINTENNGQLAEKSFTKWADSSDTGKYYKEVAQAAIDAGQITGLSWWQVLNNLFQINGNVDDPTQTVYFYMVGNDINGDHSDFYHTYCLKGKIANNVSPTLFSVINSAGVVEGTTTRNETAMKAYEGNNEVSYCDTIRLIPGEVYTLQGVLTYYAAADQTKKATSNSNRQSLFCVKTDGSSPTVTYPAVMQAVSDIDTKGISTSRRTDGKYSGSINASYDAGEYRYNGAAFSNIRFVVTADMPSTGYLVFATHDDYTQCGDNDCQTDDTLYIKYTLWDIDIPTDPPAEVAYGDMNLGRREYRSYHFMTVVEKDNPEKPIIDPATNLPTGKFEKMNVLTEFCSPYGTYETASDGEAAATIEVGPIEEPPENNGKNIFWITDDSWWETTDREWPNQVEDIDYKCWMEKNGKWSKSDTYYSRSELSSDPFDLGFRVSRSKGDTSTTIEQSKVNVTVYGVSPETGNDGEIISEYSKVITGAGLGVYQWTDVYMKDIVMNAQGKRVTTSGTVISDAYPRIRVEAEIDETHDESGIYGKKPTSTPFQNGREDEHDSIKHGRVFTAISDDMKIMEVEVRDSEGIVVYHADRYSSDNMIEDVKGYYDKEEDLTIKVVVKQVTFASHNVKSPTIDITISGLDEEGNSIVPVVYSIETKDVTLTESDPMVTFDNIVYRPKTEKINLSVQIDEIHGADYWRENIWVNEDDSFSKVISGTNADLALSQDIELYNSKGNKQDYLTFAEYLSFKFDIRHIGSDTRQMQVVGNSAINPLAKVNTKIYNADKLTTTGAGYSLVYMMVSQDPKADSAFLRGGDIQAETRLFPGLGEGSYASHVQAWIKNFIVPSFETPSGNISAHGHIVVTGNIDERHDTNHTNIRDNNVDYVQKEFKGEKDIRIVDIAATNRNSISTDTGVAVQVAVHNLASSYNDQTVIDRCYLDIVIDDEIVKTVEVDIPVGDTVVTEVILDHVDLSTCQVIDAQVNVGKHQTQYEYVLKETDSALFEDPFVNNYASVLVCANTPSKSICPECAVDAEPEIEVPDIFACDTSVETNVTDITQFEITYRSNDAAEFTDTQYVNFGGTGRIRDCMFTRTGYLFDKWYSESTGTGTSYVPGNIMNIGEKQSYSGSPRLTLYAYWIPISYTLRYDANGGTGSIDPIVMNYDEFRLLPDASAVTKAGATLSGWNTEADGSGENYAPGTNVRNLTDTNGDTVTLYAVWN